MANPSSAHGIPGQRSCYIACFDCPAGHQTCEANRLGGDTGATGAFGAGRHHKEALAQRLSADIPYFTVVERESKVMCCLLLVSLTCSKPCYALACQMAD